VSYPASDNPNPGSDEARLLGCLCPILDNNHGKHLPWTGGWWIDEHCPIHGDGREPVPA